MRRRKKNLRPAKTRKSRLCPCGARVQGGGRFFRKCRNRARWLRRTRGKQRHPARDVNRGRLLVEAVSAK